VIRDGWNGFFQKKGFEFRCLQLKCLPISARRGSNLNSGTAGRCANCSPLPGFCRDGSALGALHIFCSDGLFDLYVATAEPPLLAYRTTLQCRRLLLSYNETMQTSCLPLMGKKLLVSLAMGGNSRTRVFRV
jgi:hypothetical protein